MENERRALYSARLLDVFGGTLLLYLFFHFFKQCSIEGVEGLCGLFIALLGRYVLEKKKSKIRRLKKGLSETRKRKGELWVYIWIVSCLLMIFVNHFFPGRFELPKTEIVTLLTSVCGLSFLGKVKVDK